MSCYLSRPDPIDCPKWKLAWSAIALALMLSACSSDNGNRAEMKKAVAYLNDDPASSSTDAMTFGDPNYWHVECKGNTDLWKAAVAACMREGRHPPVCEIIGSGCP